MNQPRKKGTTRPVSSPPASLEAEQATIGAILVKPDNLEKVVDFLAPGDFYRTAHGVIYQTMLDLIRKGDPVDLVTVTSLLNERGHLEGVGGPVFLAGLSEQVGFATNAEHYARVVHDKSVLRRLLNCSQEIASSCLDPIDNVQKFLEDAETRFVGVTQALNGDRAFPLLDGTETPVSKWLKNPPPPRECLFKEGLPAGIVGGIIAMGGTGKGFIILTLGLSLATGLKVGPLEPAKRFKVVYLAGEDDQKEIERRTVAAVEALWPNGSPPPEIDNFIPISVAGKLGPLMQLDGAGNPANAPAYDWICKTLENLPGVEVLVIDPKSKFYGLIENDNGHNAAWVNCLESIAVRFKITILFSHHESKARAGSMDQASSRGGSALTDGCRWVANLMTMDIKTAEKYEITDPYNYVILDVTKSNYAAKLPAPIYFRRGTGGALSYVDLAAERVECVASKLVRLLDKEVEPLSRNDLIYEKKGKPIADELKEAVSGFNRVKDLNRAVDHALLSEWLREVDQRGKGHRGKTVLMVTDMGRI